MQLPLFPLQTVLFPEGALPLRIFEVRYLDMIGRCHKEGTPFGVVCLSEGSEVRRIDPNAPPGGHGFARETFHDVGTLAQIDELLRPQPGLMAIRCHGTQRFTITHRERLPHGLWMAEVELMVHDTVVGVPQHLEGTRDALQRLVSTLQAQEPEALASLPLRAPYHWDDCGWVANRWAELLPAPTEMKQRLMSLDNPLLRLELVTDLLERFNLNH